MKKKDKALVLFSGGQDSTLCLLWALQNYEQVETVGFDYGQRHKIELSCRLEILKSLSNKNHLYSGVLGEDHFLSLKSLGEISDTALTRQSEIKFMKNGLPTSFVPGRNLIFYTYAAAVAYRRDIYDLIGGMCEADFSGYPDCRQETLKSLETSINLGFEAPFKLLTPLLHKTKAECLNWAKELGGDEFFNLFIEDTHSCYLGVREEKHLWGYGCGDCPACSLRIAAYKKWAEH